MSFSVCLSLSQTAISTMKSNEYAYMSEKIQINS